MTCSRRYMIQSRVPWMLTGRPTIIHQSVAQRKEVGRDVRVLLAHWPRVDLGDEEPLELVGPPPPRPRAEDQSNDVVAHLGLAPCLRVPSPPPRPAPSSGSSRPCHQCSNRERGVVRPPSRMDFGLSGAAIEWEATSFRADRRHLRKLECNSC